MKKSVYDKLEDIPQADRDEGNYTLINGKYVLLLDGAHPVQVKNAELVTKESQRETEKQTAVAAAIQPKDVEINNLKTQLATAQANTGLPAGQVAVPADKVQVLNNFESLGKFEDVKAKVDEYGTLKEQTETADRAKFYSEGAKASGLNEESFSKIAEQQKLRDKMQVQTVPDPKKEGATIQQYMVKTKDANGAETLTNLRQFVETDSEFKPFLSSLLQKQDKSNSRRLPETGVGGDVEEKSAASSYLAGYRSRAKKETE